jgi:hypothetical protein
MRATCAIQRILLESITLMKSGIYKLLRYLLQNVSLVKEHNQFLISKTFESVELAYSSASYSTRYTEGREKLIVVVKTEIFHRSGRELNPDLSLFATSRTVPGSIPCDVTGIFSVATEGIMSLWVESQPLKNEYQGFLLG